MDCKEIFDGQGWSTGCDIEWMSAHKVDGFATVIDVSDCLTEGCGGIGA